MTPTFKNYLQEARTSNRQKWFDGVVLQDDPSEAVVLTPDKAAEEVAKMKEKNVFISVENKNRVMIVQLN